MNELESTTTDETTAPKNGHKMRILTIDDIREVEDVTIDTVFIPEWGGSVQVASLTWQQMKDIRADVNKSGQEADDSELEKHIFIQGLVDPKISEEDYAVFLKKNFNAVQRILEAIQSTSIMSDEDAKAQETRFREGA